MNLLTSGENIFCKFQLSWNEIFSSFENQILIRGNICNLHLQPFQSNDVECIHIKCTWNHKSFYVLDFNSNLVIRFFANKYILRKIGDKPKFFFMQIFPEQIDIEKKISIDFVNSIMKNRLINSSCS